MVFDGCWRLRMRTLLQFTFWNFYYIALRVTLFLVVVVVVTVVVYLAG